MVVRFGVVEIDLDRIEIRVAGELQPVQPQVFEVIRFLYERRDRVVTKNELLDEVWGSRFVSETTLTSRIKSARRALGDTGRDQAVIRTIHGRGYRFVAEPGDVDVVVDVPPPPSDASLALLVGGDEPESWPMVGRFELLERVGDELAAPDVGGVILCGPAGSGKTRLAVDCLEHAAAGGVTVHRVTASAAASSVPLAALAPIVGTGILEVGTWAPDVARSMLFNRAHAELVACAERLGPCLVMIDDVDRLDELSVAVLSAAIEGGAVSIVGTWRPGPARHPFDELVRAGRLREIEIPALDETDIDVVLYRVLGGPIDLASLERLSQLSRGWPGLLRDLVESSRASGSLIRDDGVWRLVGPVSSSASAGWPPDGVADDALTGAELLSLVPNLHIDDAEVVIGSPALDVLDASGLLLLERDEDGLTVRLADPLLAETVANGIGPLRARRHRAVLADALAKGRKRPRDLAAIVRWSDELHRSFDPFDALVAAQAALRNGDDDAADVLVSRLDPDDVGPYPLVVRAEIAYRRRQLRRSEELFDDIDLSGIDGATAGFVLRRKATLKYQLHADYRGAIDWLAELERDGPEELAATLRSHRITLLTLLGCADEALEAAAPLIEDATGLRAIEINLSCARALLLRGDVDEALAVVASQRASIESVRLPGPEARLPEEAALSITLTALLDRGEVGEAERLLDDELVVGARASRTWSPLSAAEVALEVGRARLALELIHPALEMYRATGMHNGRLSCLAMQARAFAEVGRLDAARTALDELSADLELAVGANRWFVLAAMGRAAHVVGSGGDYVDQLLERADEAEAWGARGAAANLLALAAVMGGRRTAVEVLERIRQLAEPFTGDLWAVRVEQVDAIAGGRSLDQVRQAYIDLGYHSSAALAGRTAPDTAAAGPA